MAVEHTLQGQGGTDIATDSRDKGRCLSLYAYLRGRLEHLYVCIDKKGTQTGE